MDLRVACLLLFLSATFIGTEGGPKCCLSVSRTIPDNILLKVKTHSLQTTSGECDINAIMSVPHMPHPHLIDYYFFLPNAPFSLFFFSDYTQNAKDSAPL
uniref:Chemokine interleukin-8-like domain-containing protein n=1 Tax=Denticeps clupeoides TaxID=299321 RepID=A0AAY4CZ25_9TELE